MLIVDKYTMGILNSAIKPIEVIAEQITHIESIHLKRKKFKELSGIYFIAPTPDSVLYLMNDFALRQSPWYKDAYVIFCRPPSKDLLEKLKRGIVNDFIKVLTYVSLDFIVPEDDVFHFDFKGSFFTLYHPRQGSKEQAEDHLRLMAEKLAGMLNLLNELPVIRFLRTNSGRLAICEKLAQKVQSMCDSSYRLAMPEQKNRATLLILERSQDPVTPILHEFTYQAMANDLLESNFQGHKVTYSSEEGEKKEIILDENDSIWQATKHCHIAQVIEQVTKDFTEFKETNKAALIQSTASGTRKASVEMLDQDKTGKSSLNTIKDMKDTLSALPQYQEMKTKFSAHISIAQMCMKKFNADRLSSAANYEQNMATGKTPDGKDIKASAVLNDLVPLLTDEQLESDCKVRLIMLYLLLAKKNMDDKERRKLFEYAKLTKTHQKAIQSMQSFGLALGPGNESLEKMAENIVVDFGSGSNGRRFLSSIFKTDGKSSAVKKKNPALYELSRYSPPLKLLMEELAREKLSKDIYPVLPDTESITCTLSGLTVSDDGPDYRLGAKSLRR